MFNFEFDATNHRPNRRNDDRITELTADFRRSLRSGRYRSCHKYSLLLWTEYQDQFPFLRELEKWEYVEEAIYNLLDLQDELRSDPTDLVKRYFIINSKEYETALRIAKAEIKAWQASDLCPIDLKFKEFEQCIELCRIYRELKDQCTELTIQCAMRA